jgi:hypothetical protein
VIDLAIIVYEMVKPYEAHSEPEAELRQKLLRLVIRYLGPNEYSDLIDELKELKKSIVRH